MKKNLRPGEVELKGFVRGDVLFTQNAKTDVNDPYREVIRVYLWKSDDNVLELEACLKQNQDRRLKSRIDSKSEVYREGFSMPVGLMRALEKHDPELFSKTPKGKKKRDQFRKLYPAFLTYTA